MKKGFVSERMFIAKQTIFFERNRNPLMRKLSLNYTRSAKTLTSLSGLNIFSDLFHKFEFQSIIHAYLPKKKRDSGWKSSEKLLCGIMGFVAGAQCLDDFDWLGNDPLFREMTDAPSSVTIRKFLHLFSPRQIEQLRNTIPAQAMKQRLWLEPKLHNDATFVMS